MNTSLFVLFALWGFHAFAQCEQATSSSPSGVVINRYPLNELTPLVIEPKLGDHHIGIREDASVIIPQLATAISKKSSKVGYHEILAKASQRYIEFYTKLFGYWPAVFNYKLSQNGRVQVDLFPIDRLFAITRNLAAGSPIVTVDETFSTADYFLRQSMRWIVDGTMYFENPRLGISRRIGRPGYPSLDTQVAQLAAAHRPVTISDDDIFSGDTIVETIALVERRRITALQVVAGIQVGTLTHIGEQKIPVTAAVTYRPPHGHDIYALANVYGQSDFLPGVGTGLVVQLPSGAMGRAPYIGPFLDPSFQAKAKGDLGPWFSKQLLNDALQFYTDLEHDFDIKILLADVDQFFRNFAVEIFDMPETMPMVDLLRACIRDYDRMMLRVKDIAAVQRRDLQ